MIMTRRQRFERDFRDEMNQIDCYVPADKFPPTPFESLSTMHGFWYTLFHYWRLKLLPRV